MNDGLGVLIQDLIRSGPQAFVLLVVMLVLAAVGITCVNAGRAAKDGIENIRTKGRR